MPCQMRALVQSPFCSGMHPDACADLPVKESFDQHQQWHASRDRCHGKMGTPQNGDPGSPYSREYGDPGPHFPGKMGTPGPHFPRSMGTPSVKMGTPSMTDG